MSSSGQPYRERGGGGGEGRGGENRERDANYRSNYNSRGGGHFRGRGGTGYKPRRYWDSDDFYKDEREHGRGRRRRSYSRSRSRSYSSRSRSRSRTPPRRGRSRSPPRQQHEEYVPRAESSAPAPVVSSQPPEPYEPYVPSKDPANTWTGTRMPMTQEYIPHATNGQTSAAISQMNPYGNAESMPTYPMHSYQEPPPSAMLMHNQPPPPSYGYPHGAPPPPVAYQQPQPQLTEAPYLQTNTTVAPPPPPTLSAPRLSKDEGNEGSKKKKDKRKKKKRHHSSSSSSSSSDDSSRSMGSRRRRKSKKGRGTEASSDSSSEEEKKDNAGGLTTQQKDALLQQREGYQTKLEILEREITKLHNKEDELISNRADRQLIDENLKLQAELKGRCKAVIIVLEKIDDVLKVGGSSNKPPPEKHPQPVAPPMVAKPPPHVEQRQLIEVPKKSGDVPYDYYDAGDYWCRLCNVFPQTLQQMLMHFHSKEHNDQVQQIGIDDKPWHKGNNSATDLKSVPGAKKAPYRGMQFFSAIEGWYCRLCHNWMGDHHCAVEHLKSAEHNSNYMNFVQEHPDWETKYVNDREKAMGALGKEKKSRFDDVPVPERKLQPPLSAPAEDVESGKSIRVQMRNSQKGDEREEVGKSTAPPNAPPKDSGLDEWMNKPKVSLDIDTQKFAAIVRQKHGVKERETREAKNEVPDLKVAPLPPLPKERDLKKDDRRRPDNKVEMQISSRDTRDRDRDRYRERDNRSSRRRSRSRSRSRERRYGRRRSRSRSRSRDRTDRDRRDRAERERPDYKETVKRLPIIGKMPLFKRPVVSKDKPEVEDKKTVVESPPAAASPAFTPKEVAQESPSPSVYSDSVSNAAYQYESQPTYGNEIYGHAHMISTSYEPPVGMLSQESHPESTEEVTGDVKAEKEGATGPLPDDLQQALDIIYSAPGPVPKPVPPPVLAANGGEDAPASTESADYDYASNGYSNYMDYQPYQQSFDGYAPVGYEELDDGPPGVGEEKSSARPTHSVGAAEPQPEAKDDKEAPPAADDDMDDLRMLGIDVDDTAVVVKH